MSTTQIAPQADRMIRDAAHNLIHLAAIHGMLPTLETQPRQPLAMGNRGLRLTLRPVRNPDPAAADNCCRPDVLEKLTYHEGARYDMSLEDCLSFLADGWKETPGRTATQMVLQLTELLAAAPSKPYCWSDCTAYTAGIEGELQTLRKKVATYEARDALGLVPKPESQAARDVLAERARQVNQEGWTPEHDDDHANGDLAYAAAGYAVEAADCTSGLVTTDPVYSPIFPEGWEFKRSTPRRMLVKVAALALAELERLDRAAARDQRAST